MNYIWISIILISFFFAIISGNLNEIVPAMLNSSKDALELLFKVGGMIVFYSGIFKIAIDSGTIKVVSKIFSKFIKKIFPAIPSNHKVMDYICMNFAANLLGLGIASTPMAIKTFTEMKKLNDDKDTLSSSMVIFLVMNVASFTLFPVTIISIREAFFAKINIELIPLIVIVTFVNTVLSVLICKLIMRFDKND